MAFQDTHHAIDIYGGNYDYGHPRTTALPVSGVDKRRKRSQDRQLLPLAPRFPFTDMGEILGDYDRLL